MADQEDSLRAVATAAPQRGRLKVFLGYASGVGKSFRMLDEGRRRKERGQDVVVGAMQQKVTPEAAALLAGMEVVPMRVVDGVAAMDVDAILRRQPQICLVDGLAYDNPPGSRHAERWQDVEELLEAGISVITSVNVQYIEEQRERVEAITGKAVTQTVPQRFLSSADEIVVVDAPAESAQVRNGEADAARKLSALREMALVLAADVVDAGYRQYLQDHNIAQPFSARERILVSLTPQTELGPILESAKRNAARFHCDVLAVYVKGPEGLSKADQAALERNLELARAAGAKVEVVEADDPVEGIVRFARAHGITQIFVGHSRKPNWWHRLFGTPVNRLVREAPEMDVRVFPRSAAKRGSR